MTNWPTPQVVIMQKCVQLQAPSPGVLPLDCAAPEPSYKFAFRAHYVPLNSDPRSVNHRQTLSVTKGRIIGMLKHSLVSVAISVPTAILGAYKN